MSLSVAVREVGICESTYERWRAAGGVDATTASPEELAAAIVEDKRLTRVYPTPPNALSDEERAEILRVCARSQYSSLPPAQIVPDLANQGIYLVSESTLRILRAHLVLITPDLVTESLALCPNQLRGIPDHLSVFHVAL